MENEQEKQSPSLAVSAAINGRSDMWLVAETARRLDEKLKKEGRTTFKMKDLRDVQREIFEGDLARSTDPDKV